MADLKISQLTDGGASQATDEYVVARSGSNFRIDGASVAAAATSVGTLSSLTVSGDLTVDTSTLKVDSTNNRVGIGTATPAYSLDIVGVAAIPSSADSGALRLKYSGANASSRSWAIRSDVNAYGDFTIATSTTQTGSTFTDRLTIDASGNLAVDTSTLYVDAANNRVGIGTASPTAQLEVNGTILSNTQIQINKAGSNTAWSGPNFSLNNNAAGASERVYAIQLGASNTLDTHYYNGSSWTKFTTLDASGNLGLGVTPSAWAGLKGLQVADSTMLAYAGTNGYVGSNSYYGSAGGSGFKYYGNGLAALYAQEAGVHKWFNAPNNTSGAGAAITFTQAMTLDASGNLLVGLTTGAKFSVSYGGNDTHFGLGANYDNYISAGSSGVTIFRNGSSERARITADGVFQVTTSGTNTRIATKATSVGTAATTISFVTSGFGQIVTVNGIDASTGNIFTDLIFTSETAGPTVLSAKTISGAPAGRTYTMGGGAGTDLRLAVTSGTYDVRCVQYLGV